MPPLPVETGFESFQRLVLGDSALQQLLSGFTDREAFIRRTVELGQAHGLSFQPAGVEAALQAARRAWTDSRTA